MGEDFNLKGEKVLFFILILLGVVISIWVQFDINSKLKSLCKLLTRHHFRTDVSEPNLLYPYRYKCLICRDVFLDYKSHKGNERQREKNMANNWWLRKFYEGEKE